MVFPKGGESEGGESDGGAFFVDKIVVRVGEQDEVGDEGTVALVEDFALQALSN